MLDVLDLGRADPPKLVDGADPRAVEMDLYLGRDPERDGAPSLQPLGVEPSDRIVDRDVIGLFDVGEFLPGDLIPRPV